MQLIILLLGLFTAQLISALVTYDTIRNLTVETNEARERILGSDSSKIADGAGMAMNVEAQRVLSDYGMTGNVMRSHGDEDDGSEVEETVTAALHMLCSDILVALEKPVTKLENQQSQSCNTTTHDYHLFLSSTVLLLRSISDRQTKYHWDGSSSVFDNISWMQRLWSSRTTNVQQRSFIEQQLTLYNPTPCFGKNEVLRRGVEVVEYLNDIIDEFR